MALYGGNSYRFPKTLRGKGAVNLARFRSAIHTNGRTIWIADAHRDDGRRFVVHADEKLSAFVELEHQVLTATFYLASIKPET